MTFSIHDGVQDVLPGTLQDKSHCPFFQDRDKTPKSVTTEKAPLKSTRQSSNYTGVDSGYHQSWLSEPQTQSYPEIICGQEQLLSAKVTSGRLFVFILFLSSEQTRCYIKLTTQLCSLSNFCADLTTTVPLFKTIKAPSIPILQCYARR